VFSTEQWLRADADGRPATEALTKTGCDKLGCTGTLASGQVIALIFDRAAFAEDCTRADIIVTPLFAPMGCAAGTVIDREKLKGTGALTLSFTKDGILMRGLRAADEDRPWSPAPKRGWGRSAPPPPAVKVEGAEAAGDEPEPAEDNDDDPLY
jgi:competence protein ComEC